MTSGPLPADSAPSVTATGGSPVGAASLDAVTPVPAASDAGAGRVPGRPLRAPIRPPIRNVANYLTVLRLALVPVFLALLLAGGGDALGWRAAACAAFLVASVTDRIDGDLARSRGLVTDFGKVADPIADKALTGAALIGLSVLGELSWGITVAVLAREVGVTLLRLWVIRHGVIPASRGGKVKTLMQAVAIGLYLLPLPDGAHPLQVAVMALAVAVTYVTGLDYVFRAVRLRRTSDRAVARRRTR